MQTQIAANDGAVLEWPDQIRGAGDADVLIREANHRIANSLAGLASLMRLQASEIGRRGGLIPAAEVRGLLNDGVVRIESIGRLHRLLSRRGAHGMVDLSLHLAEVAAVVTTAFSGLTVRNQCMPNCQVDASAAGSIALIVSELITNSAKHAHPTGVPAIITIACGRRADGRLLVEVCDDGIGLPEDFDYRTDGGLGMQVIRALSAQIGGTLTMETGPLGMCSELVLPADEAN
jgi:two-component sensor histidine kinase